MKDGQYKDRTATSEVLETLRRLGVGHKFTVGILQRDYLPHLTTSQISAAIYWNRSRDGALDIVGTHTEEPKNGEGRRVTSTQYVINKNIFKRDIPVRDMGIKGQTRSARAPGEKESVAQVVAEMVKTHPRKATAQELINYMLASVENVQQAAAEFMETQRLALDNILSLAGELEKIGNQATRVDLIPTSKLRMELERRRVVEKDEARKQTH